MTHMQVMDDRVLHAVATGEGVAAKVLTDLALALCMPRRKPPICRRSSKSLSSLARSSRPPPGLLFGFGPACNRISASTLCPTPDGGASSEATGYLCLGTLAFMYMPEPRASVGETGCYADAT